MGDVIAPLNININAALRTAKRLQGFANTKETSLRRAAAVTDAKQRPGFPINTPAATESLDVVADKTRYESRIPVCA
jgi:hypothetical protein